VITPWVASPWPLPAPLSDFPSLSVCLPSSPGARPSEMSGASRPEASLVFGPGCLQGYLPDGLSQKSREGLLSMSLNQIQDPAWENTCLSVFPPPTLTLTLPSY
jgi:hypothetical protein